MKFPMFLDMPLSLGRIPITAARGASVVIDNAPVARQAPSPGSDIAAIIHVSSRSLTLTIHSSRRPLALTARGAAVAVSNVGHTKTAARGAAVVIDNAPVPG